MESGREEGRDRREENVESGRERKRRKYKRIRKAGKGGGSKKERRKVRKEGEKKGTGVPRGGHLKRLQRRDVGPRWECFDLRRRSAESDLSPPERRAKLFRLRIRFFFTFIKLIMYAHARETCRMLVCLYKFKHKRF